MNRSFLYRVAVATWIVVCPFATAGGASSLPSHLEDYLLDSGSLDNPSDQPAIIFSHTIALDPQVPWIRLIIAEASLPAESVIRVTSVFDGASQTLDGALLRTWSNTTAYFNGSVVTLELIAAPETRGNRFVTKQLLAGSRRGGEESLFAGGLCDGTDNRAPSSEPRVGRLLLGGILGCHGGAQPCCFEAEQNHSGTAFIIDAEVADNDRLLVSAGHCFDPNGVGTTWMGDLTADYVVQFNVYHSLYPSESGCVPCHPPPEDQFLVNGNTVFTQLGVGNDWAVFRCHPNAVTGKTAYEHTEDVSGARHAFPVNAPPSSPRPCDQAPDDCVRLTGHGRDGNGLVTCDLGSPGCPCSETAACGCVTNEPECIDLGSLNLVQQTTIGSLLPPTPPSLYSSQILASVDLCDANSGSPLIIDQPIDSIPTGRAIGIMVGPTCSGADGNVAVQTWTPNLASKICEMIKPYEPTDGVVGYGSYWIRITPSVTVPSGTSIALRVSSPNWDCPPKFVQANGSLGTTPVEQTPELWLTKEVYGDEFVSNSVYIVEKWQNETATPLGRAATWIRGDVFLDPNNENNCLVDVDDVTYVLDGFVSTMSCSTHPLSNLAPCRQRCSEGEIDIDDIMAILDAFSGVRDFCPEPCSSSRDFDSGGPSRGAQSPYIGTITLVPHASVGPASDILNLDVFVSGAPAVRGYEIALDVTGGSQGHLELVDFAIADRPDFIFAGLLDGSARRGAPEPEQPREYYYSAMDRSRGRMVACRVTGGSDTSIARFVGTFTYRPSPDASGIFQISVRIGDTHLRDPAGQNITVNPGTALDLPVGRAKGWRWP